MHVFRFAAFSDKPKRKYRIKYITDCSLEEMIKGMRLKKYSKPLLSGASTQTMGAVSTIRARANLPRFYLWVKRRGDLGTLAHECTHLAFNILMENRKSRKISDKDNEELASLSGELFESLRKSHFKNYEYESTT